MQSPGMDQYAVSVVEESGVSLESCQEISSLKRVGEGSSYLLHVAPEARFTQATRVNADGEGDEGTPGNEECSKNFEI